MDRSGVLGVKKGDMMFAIGNDELEKNPMLGDFILCDKCGERHKIEYGETILSDGTREPSKFLAFYTCGEKTYLAGIRGKDIRKCFVKKP